MKKTVKLLTALLLLAALILGLTACGDSIVGKWDATRYDLEANGLTEDEIREVQNAQSLIYEFRDDGKMILHLKVKDETADYEYTYKTEGKKLTLTNGSSVQEFTWTIRDGDLILTRDGISRGYTPVR